MIDSAAWKLQWRLLAVLAAGAIFVSQRAGAEEKLPPIENLSVWDSTAQIKSAFGYKDNVLLSPDGREKSTFLKASAETAIRRLPTDGTQFTFFALGSDTRFLDSVSAQREQLGIISGRIERQFNQRFVAGASIQYVYQDQVFDVSATEPFLRTVRLHGHGLSPRVFFKSQFREKWWLESELGFTRQYLDSPLDDYWEYGPLLSLHFQPTAKSEYYVKATIANRSYDQRPALHGTLNSPGAESLEFLRPGAEFGWIHVLDRDGLWRLRNSINYQRSADNGNGFFDFNRYSAQSQLVFSGVKWQLSVEGSLYYYEFENQSVSLSQHQKRELANISVGFGLYRRINRLLKIGVEAEKEHALTNESDADYLAHMVSLNFVVDF